MELVRNIPMELVREIPMELLRDNVFETSAVFRVPISILDLRKWEPDWERG